MERIEFKNVYGFFYPLYIRSIRSISFSRQCSGFVCLSAFSANSVRKGLAVNRCLIEQDDVTTSG
jgi:hypothetical protein